MTKKEQLALCSSFNAINLFNKNLINKILILILLFISSLNVSFAQTSKKIDIQGCGGKLKAVIYKPPIKNGNKIPFVIICYLF